MSSELTFSNVLALKRALLLDPDNEGLPLILADAMEEHAEATEDQSSREYWNTEADFVRRDLRYYSDRGSNRRWRYRVSGVTCYTNVPAYCPGAKHLLPHRKPWWRRYDVAKGQIVSVAAAFIHWHDRGRHLVSSHPIRHARVEGKGPSQHASPLRSERWFFRFEAYDHRPEELPMRFFGRRELSFIWFETYNEGCRWLDEEVLKICRRNAFGEKGS